MELFDCAHVRAGEGARLTFGTQHYVIATALATRKCAPLQNQNSGRTVRVLYRLP